jgi:uncharacterized protein
MHRKLSFLQRFNDGSSEEPETDVKIHIVMDEKDDNRGRLNLEGIEFKASKDEKGVIEGYAATFGNVDRHGDIIEKGAFKSTRKRIPIFGMHNPREGIGTGTVTEDEKGLKIKIKLAVDNDDSAILRERALEYYAMAKEGIIERMSIGFATLEKEWINKKIGGVDRHIRLIKKIDLMETSLVPIPANDLARVTSVKSIDDDKPSETEEYIEKLVEEKTLPLNEEVTRLTKENDDLKAELKSLKTELDSEKEKHLITKTVSSIIASRLY